MSNPVKLSEKIKLTLYKQGKYQKQMSLVYMWVKTEHITFKQFLSILNYLNETQMEEKHPFLRYLKNDS